MDTTKKLTNKQVINALNATPDAIAAIAATLNLTSEEVAEKVNAMAAAANVKHASKPSAETLKNRQLAHDVADEINARGREYTAKELTEVLTDEEGTPITSSRRVGAILRNALALGLIDKSPEPWSVAHVGPKGFTEWAKKPVRVKKEKAEE